MEEGSEKGAPKYMEWYGGIRFISHSNMVIS
ncbi:MAG: hypothetical protein ACJ0P4_08940 [Flavobacteriaceae bacterium]